MMASAIQMLCIVIGKNGAGQSEYYRGVGMGLLGDNVKRQVVVTVKYLLCSFGEVIFQN
jgi:predicted ATPase